MRKLTRAVNSLFEPFKSKAYKGTGVNWPDFGTGWKLLCQSYMSSLSRGVNWPDFGTGWKQPIKGNLLSKLRHRCELTGLWNGMKTARQWVAPHSLVWTDRTLERDENYRKAPSAPCTPLGVNWPDFGTGWKRYHELPCRTCVFGVNWPDFGTGWKPTR